MPILKKELELDDGRKVWVRQASGMERLKLEASQARVFRSFRHFGPDPTEWTEEQQLEFADAMDNAEAGPNAQIEKWVPECILEEDLDINTLTTLELHAILRFVRGDDPDGAVPFL